MSEYRTPKKKVCIVDDESNIREIYETILKKSGYDVITAANGEEGIRLIKEQRPDVVLADIMMPEVDGIEMIIEIRKDKDLIGIPVVVMTNIDNEETFKKAGELSISFYLIKSLFGPEKVVSIVDEALQKD
jgi:two-component system, OmpR family, alkaline phosphatase synthesis response regulator PhoP